ncbi:hypothetical protein [Streptomyces sp. DH20]|uniref:hypothetical protein n=1 Tax=Streptomyces TaxID=1883 RepID=UPI0035AED310
MSSTRRGARLARLLAVTELRSWGASPDLTEHAEFAVAELAANTVLHGRVQGRGFRLTPVIAPSRRPPPRRGPRRPRRPPPAPLRRGYGKR